MAVKNIGVKKVGGMGAPLEAFLTKEQREALGIANRSTKVIRRVHNNQVRLQDELEKIQEEMRK